MPTGSDRYSAPGGIEIHVRPSKVRARSVPAIVFAVALSAERATCAASITNACVPNALEKRTRSFDPPTERWTTCRKVASCMSACGSRLFCFGHLLRRAPARHPMLWRRSHRGLRQRKSAHQNPSPHSHLPSSFLLSPLPQAGEECHGRSCPRHDLWDAGGIPHRGAGEGLLVLLLKSRPKRRRPSPPAARAPPLPRRRERVKNPYSAFTLSTGPSSPIVYPGRPTTTRWTTTLGSIAQIRTRCAPAAATTMVRNPPPHIVRDRLGPFRLARAAVEIDHLRRLIVDRDRVAQPPLADDVERGRGEHGHIDRTRLPKRDPIVDARSRPRFERRGMDRQRRDRRTPAAERPDRRPGNARDRYSVGMMIGLDRDMIVRLDIGAGRGARPVHDRQRNMLVIRAEAADRKRDGSSSPAGT